jgi:hypothetical protein
MLADARCRPHGLDPHPSTHHQQAVRERRRRCGTPQPPHNRPDERKGWPGTIVQPYCAPSGTVDPLRWSDIRSSACDCIMVRHRPQGCRRSLHRSVITRSRHGVCRGATNSSAERRPRGRARNVRRPARRPPAPSRSARGVPPRIRPALGVQTGRVGELPHPAGGAGPAVHHEALTADRPRERTTLIGLARSLVETLATHPSLSILADARSTPQGGAGT